jgi:hypothetical protein
MRRGPRASSSAVFAWMIKSLTPFGVGFPLRRLLDEGSLMKLWPLFARGALKCARDGMVPILGIRIELT